jgi:hypothetical protein
VLVRFRPGAPKSLFSVVRLTVAGEGFFRRATRLVQTWENARRQIILLEATVKTRLHRARALLRKELEKDFGAVLAEVFPFDGARCNGLTNRVMARIGLLQDRN